MVYVCDVLGDEPKTRRPKSALQTLGMPLRTPLKKVHPVPFSASSLRCKLERLFWADVLSAFGVFCIF